MIIIQYKDMCYSDIYYSKPYITIKQTNIIQNNFNILQQEIIDLQKELNKEKRIRRKQSWTKRKYI